MSSPVITPLDLLLPYQRAWVDDGARYKIGVMSRQSGKDFSTACEAVRDCMASPSREWMIAAPSERQAMESLAKCKDWCEAFGIALEFEQIERDGPGELMKSGSIHFANKSRIIAVPGRPDTVRGMSANLVLTEFAFFDDPSATWRAVLPSITNPLRGGLKKVRLITTPNGKTGRGAKTYQIYAANYLNPDATRKQRWSVHKVTIEDAVRDGLPVDIDELRDALDDPEGWAQEYMCEFIDSSNVLLPYDIIALAESVDASTVAAPEFFWPSGRDIRCGIDFGRSNDPTVCWTLELVGGLEITREVLVLRDMSTPDQEAILRSRIAACTRCCLDYTGPGIGLGDYLAKEFGVYKPDSHEFGKIELCTFTPGFKREIFPKLRRAFESPVKIRIPVDVDVREDLHSMQQVVTNGAYSYTAPRTAEGHSDRCTALALAHRAAESARAYFDPIPCTLGGGSYDADPYLTMLARQSATPYPY